MEPEIELASELNMELSAIVKRPWLMTTWHQVSPKCSSPNFTLDPTLLLAVDLAAKLVIFALLTTTLKQVFAENTNLNAFMLL